MPATLRWILAACLTLPLALSQIQAQAQAQETLNGWTLQDAAKVPATPEQISTPTFHPTGWFRATVPGTVLTTLVDNKVYPEPLYGENNRPDKIPDSLSRTPFWYRTVLTVPKAYAGRHIWLNFEGINYASEIWLNGQQIGTTRGAFIRGTFDISANV